MQGLISSGDVAWKPVASELVDCFGLKAKMEIKKFNKMVAISLSIAC